MSSLDETQVMVTLAALAYVAPIPGDAVHTIEEEQAYMLSGLTLALADVRLATRGEWSVVWVGLNDDQGNFTYIARHQTEGTLAVAVRGTVFAPALAAISDACEDLRVWALADFPVGDDTVKISEGASTSFDGVTGARFAVSGHALSGMTLVAALKTLVTGGGRTIYVTGHSLGGCASTLLGLYLQNAFPDVAVQVYTFAAPTAGLQAFADLFDRTFGGAAGRSARRVVNRWDVVPHAWATLGDVGSWYSSPGPGQTEEVSAVLFLLKRLPLPNDYVQPSTNVVTLNELAYGTPGSLWDATSESASVEGFIGQILFQHSVVHAYMALLGVPLQLLTTAEAAATEGLPTVTLVEPGFVHVIAPVPS